MQPLPSRRPSESPDHRLNPTTHKRGQALIQTTELTTTNEKESGSGPAPRILTDEEEVERVADPKKLLQ
jgi:hypothetical protein